MIKVIITLNEWSNGTSVITKTKTLMWSHLLQMFQLRWHNDARVDTQCYDVIKYNKIIDNLGGLTIFDYSDD